MRTRVSWICALVSLAISTAALASAPPLLPLQGVLTDADGVPLAAAVSIRFSLHTAETGGTEVWYETQTITPVDGLFAAYLGQGTGGTMTLATFRDQGELWLEVKVGGDDPMARVRLASVGYAGYAEYCGNVPPHTHPASDLPAGLVIGAQSCSGSDKVRGVSSSGAIVCSPDLGTGPDTLGQLNCTTGQTVKWNGSVWACAADDNSGGTITAVNAGSGLSASTAGTVATLGLSNACTSAEVLRYDGSAWQCTTAVQAIATPAAGGLAFTTSGATYNLSLKAGCANGQVLKYNTGTSSWDCASDANSGGDITDVLATTGGGLTVTNSSGPQPSLGLQACATTGQVLKYTVGTGWDCANDDNSGGTITAVNTPAGGGLSGGVTSGAANLKLAACSANQVLRSAGATWGCVDDVTAVNTPATGGLTGGGASGALGIQLKTCTAGQVLKSVGTGWDCANDNNSGGTVTSVGTGAGLTGGPITTTGSVAIATGGVTNAMLANASLTVTPGTGLSGGGAVALGGSTTISLSTPVTVANGGTGAGTAAGARTNLGAAASGANTDITSLNGLDQQNAVRVGPYGAAAGNTGEIQLMELNANGAQYVGFKAPDSIVTTRVWTLPATDGSAGQLLHTDGNGHLAWSTPNGGSVTSVGTGAGLTGGPITTTGTISIPTGGVTNPMLVNSGLTVVAGSGLSGGGLVDLGASTSIALDTTNANTWTGLQQFEGQIVLFEAADPTQTFALTAEAHAGELAVDANRVLRLESTGASPNVIGGFAGNGVDSPNVGAVIGGGGSTAYPNTVSASYCTIGGGYGNQCGTAAAGAGSTVAGGYGNSATGQSSAVGGGYGNIASGDYSAVPGGLSNQASKLYSFAAGRRAKANADGCFVWGDSTDDDVTCGAKDQFVVRAAGGATVYTSTDLSTGVSIGHAEGAWSTLSDRELKRDFTPVDARGVLARVAAMPLSTWRYKADTAGVRHMGPMAQDFHAAFGLGTSDRTISTVDADGVALAAIQGLHQADGELRAENEQLRARLRTLEPRVAQLDALEQRLAKLEQAQPARGGAGTFGWGAFGLLVAGGLVVARRRRDP